LAEQILFLIQKKCQRVTFTEIDYRGSPPAVDVKVLARKRVSVLDTLSELDFLVFKCSLPCSGKKGLKIPYCFLYEEREQER
jgi:hypothetical protein